MSEQHVITGIAAPLPINNLDTDQIMPKQFLLGIDKSGLARGVLYDLRFDTDGRPLSSAPFRRVAPGIQRTVKRAPAASRRLPASSAARTNQATAVGDTIVRAWGPAALPGFQVLRGSKEAAEAVRKGGLLCVWARSSRLGVVRQAQDALGDDVVLDLGRAAVDRHRLA